MDCPSEEHMIRMKLSSLSEIFSLEFDISNRKLVVIHNHKTEDIFKTLDELNFDTSLIEDTIIDDFHLLSDNSVKEEKLLWNVLIINFFFFLLEVFTGLYAESLGLIADGLDMLADSVVYGLALYAVRGTVERKKNVAKLSGYFQICLAFFGFFEVVRRFIAPNIDPDYKMMIIISIFALIGNALSLYLLQKSRNKEAHIQASMIFTSNDVIVNLGVILAGILVYFTNSKYPDLVIGGIVLVLVLQGAVRILKLAK